MAVLVMRKLSMRYLIIIVGALVGLHLYYYRHAYQEAANHLPKITWTSTNAQEKSENSLGYKPVVTLAQSDAEHIAFTSATTRVPTPTQTLHELQLTPVEDPNVEVTGFTTQATSASSSPTLKSNPTTVAAKASFSSLLPCADLKGAENIVFVIKTGSTEAMEKLPVHFGTTLRCFPQAIIFSDFGEIIQGHEVRDAVGNVSSDVRDEDADFALWRKLQEIGRAGLDPSELRTQIADPNEPNFDNGGWRLDKFKNIPMVVKSLESYPDAKWFVFTDADTYIVWSNLVYWMSLYDHTELRYLGSATQIDNQVFGHGGSGYVISNAAAQKVAEEYNNNQTYWDKYAAGHWAGDCVLATALEKIGAPLTWASPMIQGGDPVKMDYTEVGYYERRLWCYPVVSYHHILPSTVYSLWHLEQEWTTNHTADTAPLRHSDVFKQWVMPKMEDQREDWDNLSEDVVEEVQLNDASDCRLLCAANSTCLQYSFYFGQCRTYDRPKLGAKNSTGIVSGWMLERLQNATQEWDNCEEGDWIVE